MRKPVTHLVIGTRRHADLYAKDNGLHPSQVLSTSQGEYPLRGLATVPALTEVDPRYRGSAQDQRALYAWDVLKATLGARG